MTPSEMAWKRLLAKPSWSNIDLYKWRAQMFPDRVDDAAEALGLKRRSYNYLETGKTCTGRLRPVVPRAIMLAAKELAHRRATADSDAH